MTTQADAECFLDVNLRPPLENRPRCSENCVHEVLVHGV